MTNSNDTPCRRCGNCCHVDMIAFATEADTARWKKQKRADILAHATGTVYSWAGDRVVSEQGRVLSSCIFLAREGDLFNCEIYDTRPAVCRAYLPGSSELCPQFRDYTHR